VRGFQLTKLSAGVHEGDGSKEGGARERGDQRARTLEAEGPTKASFRAVAGTSGRPPSPAPSPLAPSDTSTHRRHPRSSPRVGEAGGTVLLVQPPRRHCPGALPGMRAAPRRQKRRVRPLSAAARRCCGCARHRQPGSSTAAPGRSRAGRRRSPCRAGRPLRLPRARAPSGCRGAGDIAAATGGQS
jgi:hypothetical protein